MLKITPPSKEDLRREKRVNELEKEYREKHIDPKNAEIIDDLGFKISGLIGKNNRHFVRKYTDLLTAHYNIDPGWFYDKGYRDGLWDAEERKRRL